MLATIVLSLVSFAVFCTAQGVASVANLPECAVSTTITTRPKSWSAVSLTPPCSNRVRTLFPRTVHPSTSNASVATPPGSPGSPAVSMNAAVQLIKRVTHHGECTLLVSGAKTVRSHHQSRVSTVPDVIPLTSSFKPGPSADKGHLQRECRNPNDSPFDVCLDRHQQCHRQCHQQRSGCFDGNIHVHDRIVDGDIKHRIWKYDGDLGSWHWVGSVARGFSS